MSLALNLQEGRSPVQGKQHYGRTKLRKRCRSDEPRTPAPCVGVQRRVSCTRESPVRHQPVCSTACPSDIAPEDDSS